MKMTNVAKTQSGIESEFFPNKKKQTKINTPLKIFEILLLAPEFTLREERVNEPDAGMPDRKAQPMLPKPNEIASLFSSILEPCRDASDFPIDNPSIRLSNARARDACNIISQICSELLKFGNVSK